nr:hypothetical protein [Tanacetum cinerariifolium]
MGDEHLSTIPETESDEVIKSSVKNLVLIPSESEVTSDNESKCNVPVNDESSLIFTTFSSSLFDCNDDFTSSDDESHSNEDVSMENFKINSNPLFNDEEIISTKIDSHYYNAESNLLESLLNRDTLIDSSPKFDYLLEEFSGELAHIDPIPSGTEEADFYLEEEIRLVENLLYDNSSLRSPEELNAEIANTILETISPSPILVEDNDSHLEEIDLFLATDDLMPPGIENDDYDSEGDIHFLEGLLSNDPFPLPENESSNHDDPSFPRPPPKPPVVEVFFDFEPDTGVLTTKVVKGISEHYMPNIFPTLPTLDPNLDFTPSHDSLESENKIFDSGIFTEVKSERLLSREEFSIIRDPLYPMFDSFLLFSSKNEDKVFKPGTGYVKNRQKQSKTNKTGHENEKSSRNRSQRRIHLKYNPVNPLSLIKSQNSYTVSPYKVHQIENPFPFVTSSIYSKLRFDLPFTSRWDYDPGVTSPIDHHCCYKCGDSLDDFFCHQCTCEFCGNDTHDGYNCPSHVPFIQTLPSFPQQYPCCEDYEGPHENFQLFSQSILKYLNELDHHELFINELIQQKLQNEYAQPFLAIAITFDLPTVEPEDTLRMGDEHPDTTSKTKLDEFIKSSVENLVPNPSESEDLSDSECDMPAFDDFTTFSNLLFDADDDFSSSDNESFAVEDISKEIYLNPLFDEEIISMNIEPYHFNDESDLIESLLNHDSLIISSSLKIDSLLDEFAGELILHKSIPPGINETDSFIYENSDAAIKSFSPFPIPIEDNDSFMEEINLSFTPDESMPPGIKKEDYDSKRDMLIFEEFHSNNSLSLSENESFHFDLPSSPRPSAKPPDDDSRILNVKVVGDISEHYVPMPRLLPTQPTLTSNQEKTPHLLPHRGLKVSQLSSECPIMIYKGNTLILDVPFLYFYPP